MIVRPKPNVLQLIFIWRLSVLTQIAWQLLAVFLWSVAVLIAGHHWAFFRSWSVGPFTLLGVALSIFLGFRNSACYDRWWEARRQLGSMVGEMRSWARVCRALPLDGARRRRMILGAVSFTYALMAHLRRRELPAEVAAYAPAEWLTGPGTDVPTQVLERLSIEAAEALANGEIGEVSYKLLEERLVAIAGIQVACERILGTPTPFTYTLLIHRTAYAYCFLLPLGLLSTMGVGMPIFATLVAYAFFGLDALGDELESPFSEHPNALALSALARTIEISLLTSAGERNVPLPAQPVKWVLD